METPPRAQMPHSPSPPKSARKRTASFFSSATPPVLPTNDTTTPRILHRQHHRRVPIAAQTWGPDIPLTPFPATPAPQEQPAPFNIYKALLRHPNLFFQLAIRLPYPLMTSLYAIDKEFHYRLNKYSVSLIHEYARYWAPVASHVFSWIMFPQLCISDPMLRPMDGRNWLARDVPGFKWVGMVLGRQRIVREIIAAMEEEGHYLGARTSMEEVLCKFWSIMEMPRTVLRNAFVHDKAIWTNGNIATFMRFLVKLDLRFSDPVLGNGACALSDLLLTQPSLRSLHGLLTGTITPSIDYISTLVVRTYNMDRLDVLTVDWLDDPEETGVQAQELGVLMKEGWSVHGTVMPSCLDLVVAEGVNRKMHLQVRLLDYVLDGRDEVVRKWGGDKEEMRARVRSKKERAGTIGMFDERYGVVRQIVPKEEGTREEEMDENEESMSLDGIETGSEAGDFEE